MKITIRGLSPPCVVACVVEPEGIDVGLIAGVAALSILGIGLLTIAVIAVLAVAVKFRAKLLPSVFGPGVRARVGW